jgi:glycosyltransferase involved in cell wall biosynthesis
LTKVSFIIPCFRSDTALVDLVGAIQQGALERQHSLEVILVLDSRDLRANEILSEPVFDSSDIRIIELSRNFGQHNATATGISRASGDFVVTLDDDYQHLPQDAFSIIDSMIADDSQDLVYAVPMRKHQSNIRRVFGGGIRQVLRWAGLSYAGKISPFRVFKGEFREVFLGLPGPHVSVDIVLSWVVNSVSAVPVVFQPRASGKSGYSTFALVRLAFVYLLTHSIAPLRLGLLLGFFGFVSSFVAGVAVFVNYLLGNISEPGFTSIALMVALLGSAQLLVLGILGEYVGQQHRRGMAVPLAFVLKDSRGH